MRGRPFESGTSGNPAGRPPGAKNKFAAAFFAALAKDFAAHGVHALAKLRTEHPAVYFKLCASVAGSVSMNSSGYVTFDPVPHAFASAEIETDFAEGRGQSEQGGAN